MKEVKCLATSLKVSALFVIAFCVLPLPAELPEIHKENGNVFKPKPLQPGPWVTMTKGEIWPKPQYQQKNSSFLVLDVNKFRINVSEIK